MIEHSTGDALKDYLQSNTFTFSVCSDPTRRKEISALLLTHSGDVKPFAQFYKDVKLIYPAADRSTLEKDYVLATQSARMAAKWAEFTQHADRYLLQLRVSGLEALKPLHNVALPVSSVFWLSYYPPNGYYDASNVVLIRKGTVIEGDEAEACRIAATAVPPAFRYNAAIDGFPAEQLQQNS